MKTVVYRETILGGDIERGIDHLKTENRDGNNDF